MPKDRAAQTSPVGIISGGGSLPFAVADAVLAQGRGAVLFAISGFADPVAVARYQHHWIALAQFGKVCRLARQEGCREMVFIGTVVRPSIRALRLDWKTIGLLPRIFSIYRGGDDHLLTGIARVFEENGFMLRGAHELAPEILMPEGLLGTRKPSARDQADIAFGRRALQATGRFDIGQAIVVAGNHVLAVEAAEGTDAMLARIAELREQGRIGAAPGVGVLVKTPKPNQDRRFDLPSIGPSTIEGVARAGLAGIAVIAGATVVAEPQQIAKAAELTGLFVLGCREDDVP